jgi:hypothetical protein
LKPLLGSLRGDAAELVFQKQIQAQRALAAGLVFDDRGSIALAVDQIDAGDAINGGEGVEVFLERGHCRFLCC